MGTSSITGQETFLFADNISFDGTPRGGGMTTNGQLFIGATAAPHIRVGTLTSAGGTVTITAGAGTIDLSVPAGGGLSLAAFGSTPNANGLTLTSGVLNMEPASGSFPGGVSTGTQTFAGAKTFTSTVASGVAGSSIGGFLLSGNTSGTVSILPQAAAGTFNFNLPTTAGTSGYFLTSAGGGSSPMTWTQNTFGSGTVTTVSVVTANGFAGTVANATTTPAITLTTTITGVLTGNGTAISGSTVTQHGVLVGGASNAVSSTSVGATGTVLIGNTGADPTFSATPSITSITFPSAGGSGTATSDTMSYYEEGTWTPTLDGAVSGTTTYTTQQGYYTKIGNTVFVSALITITAATGTGNAIFGGLPFTVKNQTNYAPRCLANVNSTAWAWPAATTTLFWQFTANSTSTFITGQGSTTGSLVLQMTNGSATFTLNGFYQV